MSQRRPLIMGNWKMNLDRAAAVSLAKGIASGGSSGVELAVCPSFVHLSDVLRELHGTQIGVGGQDCVVQGPGAVTGGTGAEQLAELGCGWVLVGHSERRQFFGEDEGLLAEKLGAAFRAGLAPVYCLGETLEQREAGKTHEVVQRQLRGGLSELSADQLRAVTVAYEPVWAIGTGRNAAAEDIQQVHAALRALLGELGGAGCAETVRILYGGSVKPANAAATMACPDVDGALVGGASLDAASFLAIAAYETSAS